MIAQTCIYAGFTSKKKAGGGVSQEPQTTLLNISAYTEKKMKASTNSENNFEKIAQRIEVFEVFQHSCGCTCKSPER